MIYMLQDMGRPELGTTQLQAHTEKEALAAFSRMRRLLDGEFVGCWTHAEWDLGTLGRIYILKLEPSRYEAKRCDSGKPTDGA